MIATLEHNLRRRCDLDQIREKMSKKIDFLQKTELFQNLSAAQLQKIANLLQEKTYAKETMIFFEAEVAAGFYILLQGQVKIFKLAENGKEQILKVFNRGDVFGEVPVFEGSTFPANCQTIKATKVLYLSRQHFLQLVKHDPQFALSMLALLSQRLRAFTVTIENLTLKEVAPRLAAYLLYLAKTHDCNKLQLDVSKTVLANILGVSRETLSRAIKKLEQLNLIHVSGKNVEIYNLAKLKILANSY